MNMQELAQIIKMIEGAVKTETASEVDLSRLDPDSSGKGYITETYTDGTTRETKLTYDEGGNITEIEDADGHKTTLVWPSK